MALKDFVSNVLTRYRADTSDHKRAIKKLRGEQRKLAKEQLEQIEAQNKRLDSQIERWTSVAVKVGAAAGAFVVAKNSLNDYVTVQRQMAVAGEVDFGRLQEAADGMVGKYDLMRLAASNLAGELDLNQRELEGVAEGVASLVKQGRPLERVLDRVGQAITEGNVEPLKEFGIQIKGVENDTVEAARAIAKELRDLGDVGDENLDAVARSSATMRDTMQDVQLKIGELTIKLIPLVEQFAKLAGKLGDVADVLGDDATLGMIAGGFVAGVPGAAAGAFIGSGVGGSAPPGVSRLASTEMRAELDRVTSFGREIEDVAGDIHKTVIDTMPIIGHSTLDLLNEVTAETEVFARKMERITADMHIRIGNAAHERLLAIGDRLTRQRRRRRRGGGPAPEDVAADIGVDTLGGGVGRRDFGGVETDLTVGETDVLRNVRFEQGLDRIESEQPQVEEIGEGLKSTIDTTMLASKSFGMLEQSANLAFRSILTGAGLMSKGFKKALGDMVMAQAFGAFADGMRSLGKLALNAAGLNPLSAAKAAAAAASAKTNFAIAATLTPIAIAMGATGGGPPNRGGGGNVGPSPSVRRAREGRGDRTIVFGADFLDDSAQERSRRFRRMRDRARNTTDDGAELL